MLKLFLFAALLCSLFSCSNNSMNEKDVMAYNKQKQSLFSAEKKEPLSFFKSVCQQ